MQNPTAKKFKNEEERKKILDRIKKILALANGTSFEGEANTAMKMAQSYMTQYGLSMTDVEIGEALDEAIVTEAVDRKNPHQWERILGLAVAVVTDTKSYTKMLAQGSILMFMGYKSDVDFAKVLYSVLFVAVKSDSYKKFGREKQDRNDRLSFRFGCAIRLEERATEEKEVAVKTEGNKQFALVVVEKKNRIDMWAEENLNLQNSKNRSRVTLNPVALAMGKAHANNMDLMNKSKVKDNSTLAIGLSR